MFSSFFFMPSKLRSLSLFSARALWILCTLILLGVWFVGQRWHWFAFIMHLPPYAAVLGLLLAGVSCWWLSRRLAVGFILLGLLLAGPVLGWRAAGKRVSAVPHSDPQALRLMTCNRGQSNGHRISKFIQQMQPEILIIQDSYSAQAFQPNAPDYSTFPYRARQGQMTVLSKWPILKSELVRLQVPPELAAKGAWHYIMKATVQWREQPVTLFTLHLPSPRHPIELYRNKEVFSPQGYERVTRYWHDHGFLLERAVELIEQEIQTSPFPVLAMGDWNLPQFGPLYRRITRRLQDTHAHAGQGYGFTCPGDIRTGFAFWKPWLRIDYILASHAWEILAHETELPSEAQHCAVAAVVRLR
jgi:endonuclease/exonuclease/phosphatase (EEP) superfamily protein YafD